MTAPTRIGQFEVRHLLGSGGFGHVYAAVDSELGRWVAVKALRPEISSDPSLVERFRSEGVSLARLNHTNITTLYALQREKQQLFLVMELVHGTTLDVVLGRLRRLGTAETLAVLAQTAAGLGYAHRTGVIHRDIKPSNLMLTDTGILKVMDFGIARIRGTQRLTQAGLLGTYAYLAPEQFSRAEGNERSDLYSLACVVYEMLSGDVPFAAQSEAEIMRGHLQQPPVPLRSLLPDLDPNIDAAVLRALEKNPADRFASVEEFSDAIGATSIERQAVDIVRDRILALLPKSVRPTTLIDTAAISRAGVAEGQDWTTRQASAAGRDRWAARLPALVLGGVAACVAVGVGLVAWGLPDVLPSGRTADSASAVLSAPVSLTPEQTRASVPAVGRPAAAGTQRSGVFPPLPNSYVASPAAGVVQPNPIAAATVRPAPSAPQPVSAGDLPGGCLASLQGLPVTEVIVRAASPDAVLCEAMRRIDAGQVPDGDLLMETAAFKLHHVPALAALARRYDPNQPHPAGVAPDLRRSARFYREAARSGDSSVAAQRDALRADLEHRANGGDSNASIILTNFWP